MYEQLALKRASSENSHKILILVTYLQNFGCFAKFLYILHINQRNKGCGLVGLDCNSGWAWVPIINGWSMSSTISTKLLSGLVPEIINPWSSNSCL